MLGRLLPDAVPAIVHLDLERFVMVMETVSTLMMLRDELVKQCAPMCADAWRFVGVEVMRRVDG